MISGKAPVSEMNSYNYRLTDFTRGKGKISLRFNGYRPCHNREKVIEEKGYNPVNQLVGYILSEDPTYITTYKNARAMIRKVDRDDLLQAMLRSYLNV